MCHWNIIRSVQGYDTVSVSVETDNWFEPTETTPNDTLIYIINGTESIIDARAFEPNVFEIVASIYTYGKQAWFCVVHEAVWISVCCVQYLYIFDLVKGYIGIKSV